MAIWLNTIDQNNIVVYNIHFSIAKKKYLSNESLKELNVLEENRLRYKGKSKIKNKRKEIREYGKIKLRYLQKGKGKRCKI